jgi:hypothetical protein
MPAGRTTWAYFRKPCRGAGWTTAWLDPYLEALEHQRRPSWTEKVIRLIFSFGRNRARLAKCVLMDEEGHPALATHELLVGRLEALLRHRKRLCQFRSRIRRAVSRVEVAAAERPLPSRSRRFAQPHSHY